MKEIIKKSKRGNNLEITLVIPLKQRRCNPYDSGPGEEMDAIMGMIDESFDKCGFVYRIDMDYKGKPDQWTDYFYIYNKGTKNFKKLCKELEIDIIYE